MDIIWYLKRGMKLPANESDMIYKEFAELITVVADYFRIDEHLLLSKTRKRPYVVPRQFAHYFAMKLQLGTLGFVGRMIGRKDHATVCHSVKVINDLIETDFEMMKHEKKLNTLLT